MNASQIIKGACPHDCPDTCSTLTTVENGLAVKFSGNPEHPQTRGVLCTKVSRYLQRTYHADRLQTPLKRVGKKGSGLAADFVPVSWSEALQDIAVRLQTIAQRDPQAILPYSYAGTMGWVQGEAMASRFFNRLGASRLDRTICSSAGGEALLYTYGAKVGMRVEQFAYADLILIWGSNPITSSVHFWHYAQEAKRRGARLVCIDPRRTETADKCHQHIALRPGTDAALALALMHELIRNGWLDHAYIAQHTLGFEALRERALQWPPERAAEVCGITVEEIVGLAKAYGACLQGLKGTNNSVENKAPSAAIRLNYGMQRTHGGGNAVRAVACLPALIGAWRKASGGLLLSASGSLKADKTGLQRPDLLDVSPMAGKTPRTLNMSTLGTDLNRPASAEFGSQVEALIVYNSNPMAVAPHSTEVARGLARSDLFTVVLEHFRTDTADYADYILPATTQLEHWDLHTTYGHTDVLLNQPAIAPLGQSLSNAEIFRRLAKAMGFNETCFDDNDEALCRTAYAALSDCADTPFETLMAQGFVSPKGADDAPFAHGGFATPSGKCEFYSAALAAQGLEPLPDYVPNHELPSGAFPLAMISPPARNFMNSTFANVASLAKSEGEPLLEIHPLDAAARGVQSGDTLTVYNPRGSYECVAEVTTRAQPGVVVGLGVWWRKQGRNGTNVNELTHQHLTDLGRAAAFYDCAVEVKKP